MRSIRLAVATLALITLPTAVNAQRVIADISVRQGPVVGRVTIGDPVGRHPGYYHRPVRHTVVVYREHRGRGWYQHHGFRSVRIWYDVDRDRYYDHSDRDDRRLREVVVYERDGRYYREDRRDDRRGEQGGHGDREYDHDRD